MIRTRSSKENESAHGLGDLIHAALAKVGITPGRVSRWLGVKDCGCNTRRNQLNLLGHWARRSISQTLQDAKASLLKILNEE